LILLATGKTRNMRRIPSVIVAMGASCMLVAACGSSHRGPATNAGSTSAGGATDRARATSYAHAVNLTPTDVPEMASVGHEEETRVKNLGVENAHCAGSANPYQRVVDIHSVRFKGATSSPQESVRSDVTVWPTSAVAEHNRAAELSRRGRACAQHLLERVAIGEIGPAHVSQISVAPLPQPLPGVHSSYAARITLRITGELGRGQTQSRATAAFATSSPSAARIQVPLYIDAFGFVVGRAQVGMTATSVKRPASSATEHRLLALLYRRANAHVP
jgi:hypothetical protein